MLGIEHEDALADAAQGVAQQQGTLAQLGLCLLARTDVGVGSYHALGPTGGVALHHRAARNNPAPVTGLVAHADITGIAGSQAFEIALEGELLLGQVVGVDTAGKFLEAALQFAGRIAQHLFPASGMGLVPGPYVPVPHAQSRTFQCQSPGVLRVRGGQRTAPDVGGRWVARHGGQKLRLFVHRRC